MREAPDGLARRPCSASPYGLRLRKGGGIALGNFSDQMWGGNRDRGQLRDTLARCAVYYGSVKAPRPPRAAEFDWWRQREFELAAAEGNHGVHLPSVGPYRRRWGSWEAALLHFGYTPDQVAERLEKG